MFCIKCGRDATAGNFCDECFLRQHKLFSARSFGLLLCKECMKYYEGGWRAFENENTLVRQLTEKHIHSGGKITAKRTSLRPIGGGYKVNIVCTGKIFPCKKKKEEEAEIIVLIKKIKCPECVKLSGNYYEAVAQLRGNEKERMLKNILAIMPAKRTILSRIEETKDGYDIFFLDKNDASALVRRLRSEKHLNIKVKKTYKLVGEKKSQKLYRDYYCIR